MCRARHQPPHQRGERGSVTAESAVIMPALVLLLAVLLAAAAAGMTLIRFEEAARATARAAARGDTVAVAQQRGAEIAGPEATVAVIRSTHRVDVSVTGPAPGILGDWGRWQLNAKATAIVEGASNYDPQP